MLRLQMDVTGLAAGRAPRPRGRGTGRPRRPRQQRRRRRSSSRRSTSPWPTSPGGRVDVQVHVLPLAGRRPAHDETDAVGRMVNLASQAGVVALPGESSYCIAKAAVAHLTRCLAVNGAVRQPVIAVAPTFIETGTAAAARPPAFQADIVGASRRCTASACRARSPAPCLPRLDGGLADHRPHAGGRWRLVGALAAYRAAGSAACGAEADDGAVGERGRVLLVDRVAARLDPLAASAPGRCRRSRGCGRASSLVLSEYCSTDDGVAASARPPCSAGRRR